MIDIFYTIPMIPVTSLMVILGVTLFLTIWFQVPAYVFTLISVSLIWLYGVELPIFISVAVVLGVMTLPLIRTQIVSRVILLAAQILKIFPKVSDTERAALEAGSVWMDKELFSGSPNIKTMMTQSIESLREDEQAFLDGPVTTLCEMIDDWEIQRTKQIPDDVWAFVKEHKFLGMIIPKEHGGLGLSAIGHSVVIERIASVSATMAITVMVPNSLGPAELLLHYGTDDQKAQYLSKLATGEEMPCFGLTEPTAGSDAGGLKSTGVVFKGDDGQLYLKFNWNKRWITLSGISTVIGLAFLLQDPDKLLGDTVDRGITCALIPTNTPGVDVSKRHDPLGVPFVNCPTQGHDVIMPLSCVIGGENGIGNGWTMLMDCLSAGRGISLPSLSSGGAQAMVCAASSFGVIRQQFGMSIGNFEGIEEPLARIIGKTLLLKAGRDYTCGAIDQGEKPSVISAILKLHSTEMFREIVNDSMDLMGGAAITQGPRNVIANAFKAAPIGITVEGANILTRTLIIFGQGALRCHPFAYAEVVAAEENNVKAFDRAFFGHIGHILRNTLRMILLTVTQGLFSFHYGHVLSKYQRKLVWTSAVFALMADISMLYFGGALKAKQKITGRLGDVLSYMYLATATMAYYQKTDVYKKELTPILKWSLDYCFYNIQEALVGYFENFTFVTRYTLAPLFRLLPIGHYPSDKLGHNISILLQQNTEFRDHFTQAVYMPNGDKDGIAKLNTTYKKIIKADSALKKIRKAVKSRILPKQGVMSILEEAIQKDVVTSIEADNIKAAEKARLDAIQVDAFTNDEYLKNA